MKTEVRPLLPVPSAPTAMAKHEKEQLSSLIMQIGQRAQMAPPSPELFDFIANHSGNITSTGLVESISASAQSLLHRAAFLGNKLLVAKKDVIAQVADEQSASTRSLPVHFTDNKDGTVTDTRSNLTWIRCALGQIWDGRTCLGEAAGYEWNETKNIKHQFAKHGDWYVNPLNLTKRHFQVVDL